MYKLKELETLPTLCTAQADDLKVETDTKRIWLSRCGVADGMPYDNQVSVEVYKGNRWEVVETYQAL